MREIPSYIKSSFTEISFYFSRFFLLPFAVPSLLFAAKNKFHTEKEENFHNKMRKESSRSKEQRQQQQQEIKRKLLNAKWKYVFNDSLCYIFPWTKKGRRESEGDGMSEMKTFCKLPFSQFSVIHFSINLVLPLTALLLTVKNLKHFLSHSLILYISISLTLARFVKMCVCLCVCVFVYIKFHVIVMLI